MRQLFIIIILFTAIPLLQWQIPISLLFGEKLNSPGLEFGPEGGYNWSFISELISVPVKKPVDSTLILMKLFNKK